MKTETSGKSSIARGSNKMYRIKVKNSETILMYLTAINISVKFSKANTEQEPLEKKTFTIR